MPNTITRLALGLAATFALALPAAAQTYDGDWNGVLKVPDGRELRLALHVETQGGTTSAVLNSLDQGISVPSTAVKMENGELQALYLSLGGELKGKLADGGKTLDATWTQGTTLPIKLTRTAGK